MLITKDDVGKHYFLRDETISTTAEIMRIDTEFGQEKVIIKLSKNGAIGERFPDGRMYFGFDSAWDLVRKELDISGNEYSWW